MTAAALTIPAAAALLAVGATRPITDFAPVKQGHLEPNDGVRLIDVDEHPFLRVFLPERYERAMVAAGLDPNRAFIFVEQWHSSDAYASALSDEDADDADISAKLPELWVAGFFNNPDGVAAKDVTVTRII